MGTRTARADRAGGWSTWAIRAAVLSACALGLWLYGPRAAEVVAARLDARAASGPAIDLDRVRFVPPAWLKGDLLLAVAKDLQPWLCGELPLNDDGMAQQLCDGLRNTPWVELAELERNPPDRLRLHLQLRRPVLAVFDRDRPLALVDDEAVLLPYVALPELPLVRLRPQGGRVRGELVPGRGFPDERVAAALQVLQEWNSSLAPLLSACPELCEIDTNNLGERYIVHPRVPEVLVGLRSARGEVVMFGYDRAPGHPLPRVPAIEKARVLRSILELHPGLEGVTGGDLRFRNTWRQWLLPTTGRDPAGSLGR